MGRYDQAYWQRLKGIRVIRKTRLWTLIAASLTLTIFSMSTRPAESSQAAAATVAATSAATQAATAKADPIGRENFQVDLGDFQTAAQLTYPAGQTGPFLTVILVHGSGPADMDFTLRDFTNKPLSHIFKDIADSLALHGIATVRYNKHYVTAPGQYDKDKFATLTLERMYQDLKAVQEITVKNPKVDPKRLVIYGWSEGSPTATFYAATHFKEVAGLVLQGVVPGSFADTFAAQVSNTLYPFLRDSVDADKDGSITSKELVAALNAKAGGLQAKQWLFFLLDPKASFFNPIVNAAIDKDKNSALDIDKEIVPYFKDQFAHFDATLGKTLFPAYISSKQLPFVVDTIKMVRQPVLILQGSNDANTPASGAQAVGKALSTSGNQSYSLLIYSGLGHSLGKAASTVEDNFAPIDPLPLKDLANWLSATIIPKN